MVHLVPCRSFIDGKHGWIENRFERMGAERTCGYGCGGEQAAEKHKPERARRYSHTILLNNHGPWQRHGARFYHDSR